MTNDTAAISFENGVMARGSAGAIRVLPVSKELLRLAEKIAAKQEQSKPDPEEWAERLSVDLILGG